MSADPQRPAAKAKRRRKDKFAEVTGTEMLEKAAREARPNTPREHRWIESAGQGCFPLIANAPTQRVP